MKTGSSNILPSKWDMYTLFDELNSRNGTYASLALICAVARLQSPKTRKVIADLPSGGRKVFFPPAYAVVLGRSLSMAAAEDLLREVLTRKIPFWEGKACFWIQKHGFGEVFRN